MRAHRRERQTTHCADRCVRQQRASSQEILHERGDKRRALGERADLDVLAFRMRVVADRAEAVQHGTPSPASTLPSEPPPTDASSSGGSPSSAASRLRAAEELGRGAALERRDLDVRSTVSDVPGVTGRSPAKPDATRSASALVRTGRRRAPPPSQARCSRPSPR